MKHIYLALVATLFAFSSMAQSVARFEDLTLAPDKFWNGSDLSGSFTSGGIKFYNSYNPGWQSWSGFAYSNMTDVTTAGYGNQYSAITGSGVGKSANYAVCYPAPSSEAEFESVSKISGFYVTNSTYAYFSMKNGDTFSKKFGGENGEDPDFFKLSIEALDDAGKPVDTLEFYLADFRFSDPSKDYILDKWTWVDLGAMKEARKLRFSLSSSDNSFGAMNTPSYFCIDDLNGQKPYEYQPVTYAGFENVTMGTLGYYKGTDHAGSFQSGNFRFLNDYNASWDSWSGFAASEKTDAITPGIGNQYSAIAGKGVDGTSAYAVGYPMPVSTVLFKDTVISGLYVTNSAYAYWSMKNGDAFSKKFGGETGTDEDYLILTIEGFDANSQSAGKVEFYLADFRSSDPLKDYILDSWKWVSLESLGRISKLEFSLRSTDNGIWGMNTPGYFCIDNLNREIITSSPVVSQLQASVYPNPFTSYLIISGVKNQAKVTVFDIKGRRLRIYDNVSNNDQINGLENLMPGIYVIEITEGSERFGTRLVKR
ncbi:MAG TPA: DUF4465 domain-containing protein [Prolixibacteraceae bacterium]|nr:DUF4465 domain-containing protein [Prolixibacteraceae bacterium]